MIAAVTPQPLTDMGKGKIEREQQVSDHQKKKRPRKRSLIVDKLKIEQFTTSLKSYTIYLFHPYLSF